MDVTLLVADPVPVPPPHPVAASTRAMAPVKRAAVRRAGGLAGEIMLGAFTEGRLGSGSVSQAWANSESGGAVKMAHTGIFRSNECYRALCEDV
jgi:hypothetical protein